jgi:Tfp pilus assembly protein PilZ
MNTAAAHTTHAAPRNRRHHSRVEARGVASHIQSKDMSTPGLAVENISMGGLFVRTANALEPGTRVMVQVVRPGLKRALQMTGRVISAISPEQARARGSIAGMGVSLDAADGDTEQRLRALIDDLAGTSAAVVRLPAPRAPEPKAPPELAAAQEKTTAQERRIAELEAELKGLRSELLRRNRTIGELANRFSAHEAV